MNDMVRMKELSQSNFHDVNHTSLSAFEMIVPDEHVLSDNYFRVKEEENEEQKLNIALVHYQINLLSDHFHKWRLFCIQQRVKKRMKDVAIVHREDQILSNFFTKWRIRQKEVCSFKEKARYDLLKSTFSKWRKIHLLQRVTRQRKLQLAKEYYTLNLLKISFQRWKEFSSIAKAENLHRLHQKRRIFKLWQLQYFKRKIQRRLARAHRRKTLQRHLFNLWKSKCGEKLQTRATFIERLNVVFLRQYFADWRKFASTQKTHREQFTIIKKLCERNTLRITFTTWRGGHNIKQFALRHKDWQKKYLARKYYKRWRLKIKKKHLLALTLPFQDRRKFLSIKSYLTQWQQQYQVELENHQKVEDAQKKLTQRKLLVTFFHWRIVTQQDLLVKPLALSIQQKQLRCCFEAWHNWTSFKTKGVRFSRSRDLETVRKMFTGWRMKTERFVEERRVKEEKTQTIIKKCLSRWNDFVFHKVSKRKQRVENYARLWLDTTQQGKLDREIAKADQANMKLLERVYFYKWKHQSEASQCKRSELERKADAFLNERRCYVTLAVWVRQLQVKQLLRNHLHGKKMELLRKTFEAWLKDTQTEVQSQINGFNLHFDSTINKSFSIKNFDPRRGSMPVFPTSYPDSVSKIPGIKKQPEFNKSMDASALRKAYRDQNFARTIQEEEKLGTPFTGQSVSPEDTICSEDPLNLQSFTYDSEYEMTLESSEEKSEIQHSLNLDMNNTTCSDFPDLSASDSKYFGSNPPSWTDHWKRRYQLSKETAKSRRLSHVAEFQPSVCSTARAGVMVTCETCDSSRKSSFNSSFGGSSAFSFNSNHLRPKQPEILNRTFPFVRRRSNEELMTSGIYSINTDDDNASMASTIMTENKNDKEMLLVGTLQYWRNLDVSTVFYAWFKYTARKKFLRQTQDSLLERKQEYLLHTMFLKWNRELYGRNASTDLSWKLAVGRSFKQWQNYTSLQRWKKENSQLALNKYRSQCLSKHLRCWKDKHTQKQSVSNFAKLWMTSSLRTGEGEEKVRNHRQRWDVVVKTSFFAEWKLTIQKQEIADQHYKDTLLNRTLNIWWCHNLVRETRRKKIKQFQTQHLLAKLFELWRRKMYCLKQVVDAQTSKEIDLKKMVFQNWLVWIRAKRNNSEKIMCTINRRNTQLVKDAFIEWAVHWCQVKAAQLHYKTSTCQKILESWYIFTTRKKEQTTNLQQMVAQKEQNTLKKKFTWWRACAIASVKYQHKYHCLQRELLTNTFVTWRKCCLQQKGVRFYEHQSLGKSFTLWRNHYVIRNREKSLVKSSSRKWKNRIQACQQNKNTMEVFIQTKNEIVLNETFILWKHQTQLTITAKHHYHKTLLSNILKHWSKYKNEKQQREKTLQEHGTNYSQKLLRSAFNLWKEKKTKLLTLQKIQKKIVFWNTKKFADKWRLQTKVNQFRRYYRQNQMKRMLILWRNELDLKKTWQDFYNAQLTKRYLKVWKDFHTEEKARKEIEKRHLIAAQEFHNYHIKHRLFLHWKQKKDRSLFEKRRKEKLSRKYFEKWLERIAMLRLADSMYRQNLFSKMWLKWRKELIRRNVVENLLKQDRRKLISEVFLSWLDYSRLKKSLPEVHHMEMKKIWFRKWMTVYNES
ncbi:uncharacterized protein [Clytia hemisphaerica]|uniref:Sfi1 spindle body domain-containing protein n=1 Tax=Clytia hemisphaerica TaxID=252671 RepID=A0A7M5UZU1_9CNID